MTTLFGPYWAYFATPTLFGFAVLLIVLALKPPKRVAQAAIGLAVVCCVIGVGMVVDAVKDTRKAADYMKCLNAADGDFEAKSTKCGTARVGSTMYEADAGVKK